MQCKSGLENLVHGIFPAILKKSIKGWYSKDQILAVLVQVFSDVEKLCRQLFLRLQIPTEEIAGVLALMLPENKVQGEV